MNCFFHETQPSVRTCARCEKPLCGECYHTTYPEYCWTCGLDYDNSLEKREQEMALPPWLQSVPAQYVLGKLAAAGGAWFGVTLVGSFVLGFMGAPIGETAVLFAIFAIWIVYTYGMACSVLIDLFHRYVLKITSVGQAVVYTVLGAAFPWWVNLISDGSGPFHHPINMLTGAVAALLFWGIERLREKPLMIGLAIMGTIIPIIVFVMSMMREMRVWSAGVGG